MSAGLIDTEKAKLAQRARDVNSKRSTNPDIAPIVVEFAGSPKSGKSTNIDILVHFFKRTGFKVWAPTEGASKRTPYNLKRNLVAFNTWSLNYAISELLVAYYNVDKHDLVILDRGPFDSIAWMSLLHERGDLNPDEFRVIKNFALHPKWSLLVGRLYLFTCTPDKSLEREHQAKLVHGDGLAMNTDILESLLRKYNDLRSELNSYPVMPIETTNSSGPVETAKVIASDILCLFEDQL